MSIKQLLYFFRIYSPIHHSCTVRMNFLDTIPEDALEHIVRHISTRPRYRNWIAFISAKDALAMLNINIPGTRLVIQRTFKSITVTPSIYRESNDLYFLSYVDETDLTLLLKSVAHVIEHIHLRYGSARLPAAELWLNSISSKAFSLRKLVIHEDISDGPLERILRGRGNNLQSLTVWHLYSRERIELVARHCTNLSEFNVRHLLCASEALWAAVGPSLLSLNILLCGVSYPTGTIDPSATLHGIRTHCRNLNKLYIEEPFENFDLAIAAIYASYGGQLKEANVSQLSPTACTVVSTACTNLKLVLRHRYEISAQCKILGGIAKSIEFDGDPPDSAELADSLQYCHSLEKIGPSFLRYWSEDQINAIASAPLSNLEVFEMKDVFVVSEAEKALLNILANNTGRLKILDLAVHVEGNAQFHNIAMKNSSLQRFSVSISASDRHEGLEKQVEEFVIHVLIAFKVCIHLGEIVVYDVGGVIRECPVLHKKMTSIENACMHYRTKHTFVRVGDVSYLS